jgi:predicted ATP-dependent protease
MQIEKLADLLREADYWADREGKKLVGAEQVRRAADAQHKRLDRLRERIQEEIVRGSIIIDTEGAAIGQVNGLSVLQMGGHAFGRPTRITATVRLGRGQVLDIEREVKLGGPLHSKGVLILSGFLGAHYVGEHPLSLAASLVFEQSYGGVDGDSASSAELYALLSAIAQVPIKQSLAVTGSVDQHGNVQVIGGVNEKIEGFFDLCAQRGLTGAEGVLIPAPNVKNLMLHPRVVEAVEKKQFNIYPVETIDQGIELLTGLPAGERAASGSFPKGSFNRLVQARLKKFARRRQSFGGAGRPNDNP